MKRKENLSNGRFKCVYCGNDYKLKSSLRRHLRSGCGYKPKEEFSINTTKENKKKKRNSTVEIESSSSTTNCHDCGKTSIKKDYLKRHQAECFKLRVYGCPVCGKRFKRRYHMSRHLANTKCNGQFYF
ncbi:hypothetical protein M0802_013590 [Mischocyttarus mexicanus]|nr:hypothetical protein M0802_013594 [Mischocyttarus mexicanus]KAI4482935.1 hypothetical protein M0802_013590 [Mischocyttarus mexicanus]